MADAVPVVASHEPKTRIEEFWVAKTDRLADVLLSADDRIGVWTQGAQVQRPVRRTAAVWRTKEREPRPTDWPSCRGKAIPFRFQGQAGIELSVLAICDERRQARMAELVALVGHQPSPSVFDHLG